MANLQIKGMDDTLYAQVKQLAADENRSISQQVLFLLKSYIANKKQFDTLKTPAGNLLDLAGSWEDSRDPDEIVNELRTARKNSSKLAEGF